MFLINSFPFISIIGGSAEDDIFECSSSIGVATRGHRRSDPSLRGGDFGPRPVVRFVQNRWNIFVWVDGWIKWFPINCHYSQQNCSATQDLNLILPATFQLRLHPWFRWCPNTSRIIPGLLSKWRCTHILGPWLRHCHVAMLQFLYIRRKPPIETFHKA